MSDETGQKPAREEDDSIPTGDPLIMLCSDGQAHMFQVLDDGIMLTPTCRSKVKFIANADDCDVVCVECIKHMAAQLGCDVALTMKVVAEILEEKKRS